MNTMKVLGVMAILGASAFADEALERTPRIPISGFCRWEAIAESAIANSPKSIPAMQEN